MIVKPVVTIRKPDIPPGLTYSPVLNCLKECRTLHMRFWTVPAPRRVTGHFRISEMCA